MGGTSSLVPHSCGRSARQYIMSESQSLSALCGAQNGTRGLVSSQVFIKQMIKRWYLDNTAEQCIQKAKQAQISCNQPSVG